MLKTSIGKVYLVWMLAGMALLSGCGEDFPCTASGKAVLGFHGFDSAALERVVIVRYAGTRTNVLDSTVYLLSASSTPLEYYDTVNRFVAWPHYVYLLAESGYEIGITNAGKKHIITGILVSSGTVRRHFMEKAPTCYNSVQSYYLDG